MTSPASNSHQPTTDSLQVWEREARRILKALIARHGYTYKEISRLLQAKGVDIDPTVLANRINRGTFGFAFFLMVANAVGAERVEIRDVSSLRSNRGSK